MAITLLCPTCGQNVEVIDTSAKYGKCKNCGEAIPVPPQPAKLCSVCGVDVTHAKRTKDEQGNYFCVECYVAETNKRKEQEEATPLAEPSLDGVELLDGVDLVEAVGDTTQAEPELVHVQSPILTESPVTYAQDKRVIVRCIVAGSVVLVLVISFFLIQNWMQTNTDRELLALKDEGDLAFGQGRYSEAASKYQKMLYGARGISRLKADTDAVQVSFNKVNAKLAELQAIQIANQQKEDAIRRKEDEARRLLEAQRKAQQPVAVAPGPNTNNQPPSSTPVPISSNPVTSAQEGWGPVIPKDGDGVLVKYDAQGDYTTVRTQLEGNESLLPCASTAGVYDTTLKFWTELVFEFKGKEIKRVPVVVRLTIGQQVGRVSMFLHETAGSGVQFKLDNKSMDALIAKVKPDGFVYILLPVEQVATLCQSESVEMKVGERWFKFTNTQLAGFKKLLDTIGVK